MLAKGTLLSLGTRWGLHCTTSAMMYPAYPIAEGAMAADLAMMSYLKLNDYCQCTKL